METLYRIEHKDTGIGIFCSTNNKGKDHLSLHSNYKDILFRHTDMDIFPTLFFDYDLYNVLKSCDLLSKNIWEDMRFAFILYYR